MSQHSQQTYFKVDYSIASRKDLLPIQKLIYFHLLNLSGAPSSKKVGGVYPTNPAIANALGITVRQAKDNVEKLQHMGILVSFRRNGQRVMRVANERELLKIMENAEKSQWTVESPSNGEPSTTSLSTVYH